MTCQIIHCPAGDTVEFLLQCDARSKNFDRRIYQVFRANPERQRIAQICGAGCKTAVSVVAAVDEGKECENGQHRVAPRRMRASGVTTNARLLYDDGACAALANSDAG